MKIHLSAEDSMHYHPMSVREVAKSAFPFAAIRGFVAVAVATFTLAACSEASPDNAQAASATKGSDPAIPQVLATIGTEEVTLDDVRARAGDRLDQLETQYLKSRSKTVEDALQEIMRERVIIAEANKTGKTIEDLVLAEAGGTYDPTDVEIESWYNENKARLGTRTLDEVRAQIGDLLRKKRRDDAADKLQNRLNAERKVAIKFQPYRLSFANEGAPTLGKAGAPVTLVEFSDFQCPFCRQFAPTLHQLDKNFGDKLQIVYRQYPIPSLHPNAFKAAEASLCAHDQGKFWALHDMMFGEQDRLSVTDLKEKAKRLGMDTAKFNTCLDTGKYTEQVQKDSQEAVRSGATGTPAVYVNGVEVPGGAVPYSTIAAAIERELARIPAKN
jgi:protein-disulfide isomerase